MSEGNRRRLSAILAADLEGYTRLMEKDAEATVAALQSARKNIIKPSVSAHSGTIVKLMGDGFLVEFPTVHDAVGCAIAMQNSFGANQLNFRMGINMGDIVDDGEDIYGEGVNIAARLESLARAGEICISGAVYDQVRNSIPFSYEDIGEQELKNVCAPVRVFRLIPPFKKADANIEIDVTNQEIAFCTTPDNVKIAYSTIGIGSPVVIVANWLTHLEMDLQIPHRRELIEMLAENHTVVRYDARGNGLSDLHVDDISFEASLLDLEAVIADVGIDHCALLGQSQGAAIAAAYTARHPQKVSKLALYGGYARGRRKRDSQGQIAESEAFITMIREGWGRDIDTYVQMFGTFFMPDANSAQLARFTLFQRTATPPENAARIQLAIDNIDISGELGNINVPTLVLHVREDARSSFDEGRRMAAGIPNSRFVPLPGRNHVMLPGEAALSRYLQEINSFLNC